MNRRETRLYNVLFPVWLLVWIPSPLWIALIPLNYLIDYIVLRKSLRPEDVPDIKAFCNRYTFDVCLTGFISDFIGAAVLFGADLLFSNLDSELADRIAYGLGMNPFNTVLTFLITLLAVAVSALLIFFADRAILKKRGLSAESAGRCALRLALWTAPYLFFFPSSVIYM